MILEIGKYYILAILYGVKTLLTAVGILSKFLFPEELLKLFPTYLEETGVLTN